MLAYKRAMQLSELLSITMGNQTKFSTAVSEICRNVVEYVGNGQILLGITEVNGKQFLEATVTDRGRGIGNIEQLLKYPAQNSLVRGSGIANSRKLVDYFHIESDYDKGTKVILRQRLPLNAPTVTKAVADSWMRELDQETVSPYAEIKKQNMQLLEVLENLKERNDEAEQQLEEISRLNDQLQESNSNIQELLQEREKQNKLLQKINNDLDAFAHTVSHDLRAPLQNISSLTNAIEESVKAEKTTDILELLPMLQEQTQRMDTFITGVLSYSLAGQSNILKTKTDVQTLLQDIIRLLGIKNSITLKLPSYLPQLLTEKIFLHQVFSNILNNAVKYHDKKEKPVIEIQFMVEDDWLRFAIQDNGPGISHENKKRIFEMYETGDNGNFRRDSVGLGLAIVQKIIKEKGGKVWVESTGRGATFLFTWPASELIEL